MTIMIKKMKSVFLLLPLILFTGWHNTECSAIRNGEKIHQYDPKIDSTNVIGFGFLSRIVGLWNGPVFSSTPAGSFDNWYVDFRPVAYGQVSEYSTYSFRAFNKKGEADEKTLNYISFFIVKHDNKFKVAMRTEGSAYNKKCITYEVIDTIREPEGYYKFSDFQSGDKRAYTEFTFKNDSLIMEVYTSKFNKVHPVQLHSKWTAKCGGRQAASEAISYFNFPRPVMVKDFTDVFKDMPESIFFTDENDPYSCITQPYVGNVTINISIDKTLKINDSCELFLLLTTESLFDGLMYKKENLKYISRYGYLPVNIKTFTFNYIHPGKYYLYLYCDVNNDRKYLSGDYMCSDVNNIFTLIPNGNTTVDSKVDFVIP